MPAIALIRSFTDEPNNQIMNALIDTVCMIRKHIREQQEFITDLKSDLIMKLKDMDRNIDLFLDYVCVIFHDLDDKSVKDIFKYDDKFYGFIKKLYLSCYDAYVIAIKLQKKGHKFKEEDLVGILNMSFVFLKGSVAFIDKIKFSDILNNA